MSNPQAIPGLLRSGLYMRREPSLADRLLMDEGESQWSPKILKGPGDKITADMSSPFKGALLAGLAGGVAGGYGGAMAGRAMQNRGYMVDDRKLAAYTSAIAAGLAALTVYIKRKEGNEDLRDELLRLPEGATRRDRDLNPILGAEESPSGDGDALRNLAAVNAALRGRYREKDFTE
jgi:hypothetical protein